MHMDSPRAPLVLVVDDDDLLRELLTTRLMLAGYETCQASNGREGLDAIERYEPAAVVLDINMPVMDGFGVLEALNASSRIDSLPIMMLTARNQSEDVQRGLQMGARDFMTKPFSDAVFLSRIARLLRRRVSPTALSAATSR